ncbi:MAG: helix-turn-helix domain-containing protein [Brevundimonas sp.]|uniref:helix-turn-helix domain-containing protein n=1 Tax=Brevundimonas sp. TaxID=1871086 RepID=UPI0040342296
MAGNKELLGEDMARAGAALRVLRKRLGISGEEAAHRAGVHAQTWRNYENGRRLMDNETLGRMVAAVSATVEDHAQEMARTAPASLPGESPWFGSRKGDRPLVFPVGGVAHGGGPRPNIYDQGSEAEVIDFTDFLNANTRILRLAGMSMVPYAEPGGWVSYNPLRPARRGQGAVIHMKDGSYQVKRFERIAGGKVHVTELYPEERELTYELDDVEGVYAIGLRGD